MPLLQNEEVETLRARVKELESLLGQRCDGIDCDRGEECVKLQRQLNELRRELEIELRNGPTAAEWARTVRELDAANADRARLREALSDLGPEEVWFHKDKTGYWQWSFDPPLKRHELKFTRLVRADALDELAEACRELSACVSHSEFCDGEETDVTCSCGVKQSRLKARAALAKVVKL